MDVGVAVPLLLDVRCLFARAGVELPDAPRFGDSQEPVVTNVPEIADVVAVVVVILRSEVCPDSEGLGSPGAVSTLETPAGSAG